VSSAAYSSDPNAAMSSYIGLKKPFHDIMLFLQFIVKKLVLSLLEQ